MYDSMTGACITKSEGEMRLMSMGRPSELRTEIVVRITSSPMSALKCAAAW